MHPAEQPGWLIVGHGTRDTAGQAEFVQTARVLQVRAGSLPVAHAYLELVEPTIEQGLQSLVERGVQRVLVVPLLLFTAGHAQSDVPQAIAQAAKRLGIEIVGQTTSLELQSQLLALSRLRYSAALQGTSPSARTMLLMVGRGGSDQSALAAMQRYTATMADMLGVESATAFVALAKPTLPETLQELAARQPATVVVQPHLLFQGEVLATISRQVALQAERSPEIDWRLAAHLGPHPFLIEAIVARISEVAPNSAR